MPRRLGHADQEEGDVTLQERLAGALGLATRREVAALRERVSRIVDETAEQLWEKVGARASALMAELNSLRESDRQKSEALVLAQTALADQSAGEADRTKAAVDAAVALNTAADIERARGLLKALGDEAPVEVPATPETPAPGEPAQIPDTPSGVEVPPVDESALPSTDASGTVTGDIPAADVAPVVEAGQTGGDQASS